MKNTEKLNITRSLELFNEAKKFVPGGVLGARKPSDFIEGEYPIFLEFGKDAHLTDVDGNEYIDFLCGYGPIILGYREEEVDDAVIRQIKEKGFCFTLTQRYQNLLAQKAHRTRPLFRNEHFSKDRFRCHYGKHPHCQGVHKPDQGYALRLPRLA